MTLLKIKIEKIVESGLFRYFILGVILVSAIIVGIETYPDIYSRHHMLLHTIDRIILIIFAIEISLKILAKGSRPWISLKTPGMYLILLLSAYVSFPVSTPIM